MTFDSTVPPLGVPKTDTSAHVLICVGPRCTERGARNMYGEVWAAFEKERLAYYQTGGSVRLTEAGCLGACEFGPTVACYSSTGLRSETGGELLTQTWRVNMTTERIVDLARSIHDGAKVHTAPKTGREG